MKSNQAHPASFDPILTVAIQLASPGARAVGRVSLPFRSLSRPVWPIDRYFIWSPQDSVR